MDLKCNINEISDGRLYELNDLARLSSDNCNGCSACCQNMGNTIILDPFDVNRLTINLRTTFEQLLIDKIELNVNDGIILPNIKMVADTKRCYFLNTEGRCKIHGCRPSICRIFPLGRYYDEHAFKYFLYKKGCLKKNRGKVKIKKWIEEPDGKENEQFLIDWHYFIKNMQNVVKNCNDDGLVKEINMYILNNFFIKPYDKNISFYIQFNERLTLAKNKDFYFSFESSLSNI